MAIQQLGINSKGEWTKPEDTYVYGCSIKHTEYDMLHFNTDVNGVTRSSETPVCKPAWIRLTKDGQTCDSEGLESIADASECQEAIDSLYGVAPQQYLNWPETDIEESYPFRPFGCHTSLYDEEWGYFWRRRFNTFKHSRNGAVDNSKEDFIYCRNSPLEGTQSDTAVGKINFRAQEAVTSQNFDFAVNVFAVIGVLGLVMWAYQLSFVPKQQYLEVEGGAEEI